MVIAIWLYILFVPQQKLPDNLANGIYANRCCGSLSMLNGKMSVGRQLVSYVVERDKKGVYVLPAAYVGVYDGKTVQIDHGAYPLKLYLDEPANPNTIKLYGGDANYAFNRIAEPR